MKANIFGHEYDVVAEEGMHFNTGNWGSHSYAKLEIAYDPDMKSSVAGEAIHHELVEAVNFWNNLQMEHHTIWLISGGMFNILKNNPELRKLIFEEKDVEK